MFELLKILGKTIYYTPLIILKYKTIPDLIHSFGVFYVKLAQIVTTRSDILSPWLIESLKPLQDRVPIPNNMPSKGLIAAGSMAIIYDLGDNRIKKIKRPGVEQEIAKGTVFLTQLFQSRLGLYLAHKSNFINNGSKLVNLIQEKLPQHLNFEQEVANSRRMATLLGDSVHIPEVHSFTQNEIIMQKIDGVPLAQFDNKDLAMSNLLNAVFDMLFVHRVCHGDFHEGNILVAPKGDIALLDFAVIYEIADADIQHLRNFFIWCIQKDYSSLCQCMTLKQNIIHLDQFELAMKDLFGTYQFDDLYHFLNKIIQICLFYQVELEHSLLAPMTLMISAEGLAKKYSKLSLTSVIFKRFNDLGF